MSRLRAAFAGICTVALGLTLLGASMANAEAGAKWLYAKASPESSLVPFFEETLGLESASTLVLHTEVLKVKVLVLCVWIDPVNTMLLANGSIGGLNGLAKEASFRFSSCTTDLNGAAVPECTPNDASGKAQILTKLVHGLLVLGTSKEDLVKITPDEGETFAVIEMGKACPIGPKIPLIGKLTIKDGENLALTHLSKHLIQVGPSTELWAISKTAEHTATLLGSAWAYLLFGFGMKFSGDPA